MEQNKKLTLIILFAFLVSFFIIFSSNIKSFLNDFKKEEALNTKQEIDTKKEAKIIFKKETLNISKKDLLNTKDWKVYENEYLRFKYPANWFVFERRADYLEKQKGLNFFIRLTPTKNPESPNNKGGRDTPWARIDFFINKKSNLPLKKLVENELRSKKYFENISFLEVNFFGKDLILSSDFFENSQKEVYLKTKKGELIYVVFSLQIKDQNFSKIFYTILSTLEFKSN